MTPQPIGQAVVTDPGGGRPSGYVMVASSESVTAEDAQHLTVAPQITDYLHLEPSPGPFFSFYPLPSGRWALVRRFVHGTRRGAFNRVVVHTMLVPREVLKAVREEPWILLSKCRFRAGPDHAELTAAELSNQAAIPGLKSLPDLECLLGSDPRTERYALLRRRSEKIRQWWGEKELAAKLQTIFALVASGRHLLLAQDRKAEQLLGLAWSALPAADRLKVSWTTHLAPAAGPLFRLANAPDPATARCEQADPDRWWVPGEDPEPTDQEGGSAALAQLVATVAPQLAEVYGRLRRQGLSLAEDSAGVRRCITGEPVPPPKVRRPAAVAPEPAAPTAPEPAAPAPVSLAAAVGTAGDEAQRDADPRSFMLRRLRQLLPVDPRERARAVIELLLSPVLRPWVKRLIESELRDRTFELAGVELVTVLPPVGELMRRSNLLLRVAAALGKGWRKAPGGVAAFVEEAAELGRWDAVAACLLSAERGRKDFLSHLARGPGRELLRRLDAVASQPAPPGDLLPFAGRIRQLLAG